MKVVVWKWSALYITELRKRTLYMPLRNLKMSHFSADRAHSSLWRGTLHAPSGTGGPLSEGVRGEFGVPLSAAHVASACSHALWLHPPTWLGGAWTWLTAAEHAALLAVARVCALLSWRFPWILLLATTHHIQETASHGSTCKPLQSNCLPLKHPMLRSEVLPCHFIRV